MIYTILLILAIHYVADFLCQTRKMGINKGKSIHWLTYHVLVYSIVTTICWSLFITEDLIQIVFVYIATFSTHWVTDFVTSRVSGYCYLKMKYWNRIKEDYDAHLRMEMYTTDIREDLKIKQSLSEKKEHKWQFHFWSVIGLDQLIHAATLLITYKYLIENL